MRRRIHRLSLLLALAGLGILPSSAGAHTWTLENPASRARVGPDGRPPAFEARAFPHLLRREGFPHGAPSGTRPGNARISSVTGLPGVLRREPNILAGPAGRSAAALRAEEAGPETVRIAAFRVDFLKDTADYESTGDGRFDLRPAEEAKVPIDPPPHNRLYFEKHLEALKRYYDVQSHGGLVLEYKVFPEEPDSAYHLSDTSRYGPWIFSVSSDSILARAERIVRESIQVADRSDSSIDWKRYKSFLVFHAGADFQGDIQRDTDYDIPSFNLQLEDSLAVYAGGADSVKINLVMVVPETVSQDEFLGALNGVLAHEFGHQLGFFDLYNVWTGSPVVGVFSLMDSGESLFGALANPYDSTQTVYVRGVLPASLDPWHRALFFPQSVNLHSAAAGDTLTEPLPGVLIGDDLLEVPIHLDEYFLAETRPIDYDGDGTVVLKADSLSGVILGPVSADSAGADLGRLDYDFLLPAGGVLIWHIDERAAVDGLLSPFGGINVFDDRRGVDVEEADQIQDIGTASSEFLGGPLDPWFVGGFDRFGPDTVPSSDTNDGTDTGISITVLDSVATTMRVRVGDTRALPGWPLRLLAAETARDPLNRVDLDGDGFDEILLSAGPDLIALTADSPDAPSGGSVILLASMPDTLTTGAAVAGSWDGLPGAGPVVMAHAGAEARWFDVSGRLLGRWGGVSGPGATAGPVAAGTVLIVGCNDGAVRALGQGEIGGVATIAWTLAVPGIEDSITALAAGRAGPDQPFWIAAGTKSGRVYAASSPAPEEPPQLLAGWPQDTGAGATRSLLALRAPLRLDDPLQDLVLIASAGRAIDLRALDGAASVPGWPHTVSDTLAGPPAVGDPDADGILEVAATTRSGDAYLWNLSGDSERFWPRSFWEPDRARRDATTSGPRFWDLGGDGSVELVQLRGDGILSVWDHEGRMRGGWPYATGTPGSAGPLRLVAPDGTERWYFAHATADTVTALSALPLGAGAQVIEDGPGCFAGPGAGAGRTGIYPSAAVPEPRNAAAFLDPSRLIFHPNPVRGEAVRIRYVLGTAAAMEVTAFDLSGRPRAKARWEGHPGEAGETYLWDLADLAPGAYVVRLRAQGEQQSVTLNRMIAVLR